MRRLIFVLLGIVAFALTVIVLAGYGWPASRFLHGDYIQYWLASRALLEGWDPYDPTTWRAMHDAIGSAGGEIATGFGFLYPLTTPVAALPFALLPVAVAAPLWFVSQTTSLLIALVALGRRIFVSHPGRDLFLLLVLAVLMDPAYVLAGDGNLTRFMPAIIGGAMALVLRGRAFSAGLVLGLGILKPQLLVVFVPALVLFLPMRERVRVVLGGALTVGTLAAISWALRPGWVTEWLGQIARGPCRGPLGRLGHRRRARRRPVVVVVRATAADPGRVICRPCALAVPVAIRWALGSGRAARRGRDVHRDDRGRLRIPASDPHPRPHRNEHGAGMVVVDRHARSRPGGGASGSSHRDLAGHRRSADPRITAAIDASRRRRSGLALGRYGCGSMIATGTRRSSRRSPQPCSL
ncbi:MAG: hypothetical protein AUH85_12510 [Chloroflexi bacterium 13_1_40CM_4_68_4]|nr:MAG: hypothetical protein AUH85_12510 [Chloroflexi bacterium 13_1_40CM_4_68_4]